MKYLTEMTLVTRVAVILDTTAEAETARIVSEEKTLRVGAEDEAAAVKR